MNNSDMSYEEYLMWDREYRERVEYIINKYMENSNSMCWDRDDMDYPPMWESGI